MADKLPEPAPEPETIEDVLADAAKRLAAIYERTGATKGIGRRVLCGGRVFHFGGGQKVAASDEDLPECVWGMTASCKAVYRLIRAHAERPGAPPLFSGQVVRLCKDVAQPRTVYRALDALAEAGAIVEDGKNGFRAAGRENVLPFEMADGLPLPKREGAV